MDTHTAVASAVYEKYKKETGDKTKAVIASTASPFKFIRSVLGAIEQPEEGMDDFQLADRLSALADRAVPGAVEEIRYAPVLHDTVCEREEMADVVCRFLGLSSK